MSSWFLQMTLTVALIASALVAAPFPTTQPLPALPDEVVAKVTISPEVVDRPVSPVFVGNNLNPGGGRIELITDPAMQRRIRNLGMKSIRFPNGCTADCYNWKNVPAGMLTVEHFLGFCDSIDAEAYYTLNMQGGTDGLEGPAPAGASLAERIRYRHTAPNPCGDTKYHFGTLAETIELFKKYTVERALAGKRPITHFELGNENWGQSKTDWPPDVYGKTCEAYARALRQALDDAKRTHSKLASLQLHIVAVGFPTMGNNQDAFAALDRNINVAWTAEMNRLADLKLIDAVQEHFYPYGNADGSTLLWTVHNLSNILHLRYGVANPRLGGYVDPELAYRLPMEWTEWNVKCWGPQPGTSLPLGDAGFDAGMKAWTMQAEPARTGTAATTPNAARRGRAGLLLKTTAGARYVEVRQTFSVESSKPAVAFGAGVWIRSDHPTDVHLRMAQANDGPNKGVVLKEQVATQTRTWQRVTLVAPVKPDTTQIELVLRVTGENREAWLDEVQLLHWPTFSGMAPLVAARFEQQLFLVDALRVLLAWPTPRTHLHHLFGNYPCATFTMSGENRDNAEAFELLNKRIGDRVVRTTCNVPMFQYDCDADKYATDFNALAPDMTDVPPLSVLTTRDDRRLYVLMVNRTSDRTIRAEIAFEGRPTLMPRAEIRTLAGTDFDVPGAAVRVSSAPAGNPMNHSVPPHSAQVLMLALKP